MMHKHVKDRSERLQTKMAALGRDNERAYGKAGMRNPEPETETETETEPEPEPEPKN